MFKPLDEDRKHTIVELQFNNQAFKSKTPHHKPALIRLYALRIDGNPNLFVVVGGSIKATPIAQDTKMLGLELHKINEVGAAMKAAEVTKTWFNNKIFQI